MKAYFQYAARPASSYYEFKHPRRIRALNIVAQALFSHSLSIQLTKSSFNSIEENPATVAKGGHQVSAVKLMCWLFLWLQVENPLKPDQLVRTSLLKAKDRKTQPGVQKSFRSFSARKCKQVLPFLQIYIVRQNIDPPRQIPVTVKRTCYLRAVHSHLVAISERPLTLQRAPHVADSLTPASSKPRSNSLKIRNPQHQFLLKPLSPQKPLAHGN